MPTSQHFEEDRHPLALEVRAGAGEQSLGLEAAGFGVSGAVEIDEWACSTLKANRSK